MKKKQNSSIDGFIPRRSGDRLGELHTPSKKPVVHVKDGKLLHTTGNRACQDLGRQKAGRDIDNSDINESLRNLDDIEEPVKKLSRRQRRLQRKLSKKPRTKFQKIRKWVIIAVVAIILAIGGYTVYKLINASGSVLTGNIFDVFQSEPLKQDSNGRSNFLILGTSEDDVDHDGGDLTDSMLIVSIDQTNKDIYMFSVPRDLYVEYGEACSSGYSGKINAYFSCADEGTTTEAEQNRLAKTQKLVGDIFGIDIQYGIHVNHTVIKQVVDALGGVDVDIQGSNGDSGVLDRNFDWRCNYTCYYVKYDNGVHHLDGIHALFLAQARGDVAPTYGLGNSNFDREKNQQKILIAIKDKAISTGTLTNLSTVTKLIDALGSNLRTNIQTNEIRTLATVVSGVESSAVHTLSLVDEEDSVVTTGYYGGASVVMPAAGIYDYTEIQTYIKKNLSSDEVTREAAPIVVLNGTGQTGYGQTKADALTAAGFNISLVDNAPDGTYENIEVYQIGTGNSATAAKLASLYGVTVKTTTPPLAVSDDIRFVIVFGATTN